MSAIKNKMLTESHNNQDFVTDDTYIDFLYEEANKKSTLEKLDDDELKNQHEASRSNRSLASIRQAPQQSDDLPF
jgi:hypothetical protein